MILTAGITLETAADCLRTATVARRRIMTDGSPADPQFDGWAIVIRLDANARLDPRLGDVAATIQTIEGSSPAGQRRHPA